MSRKDAHIVRSVMGQHRPRARREDFHSASPADEAFGVLTDRFGSAIVTSPLDMYRQVEYLYRESQFDEETRCTLALDWWVSHSYIPMGVMSDEFRDMLVELLERYSEVCIPKLNSAR